MAHYAYLDDNNIVVAVTVGKDETELIDGLDPEIYYAQGTPYTVKRTSYNTQGGVHTLGGEPFRKNYAGIGYTYDEERDAFIPPKPYESWLLDEDSCLWEAPTPYPTDGLMYHWVEDDLNWQAITFE
jgi:hypothetical protein